MTDTRLLDTFPVIDGFVFASKLRCNLDYRQFAVQEYENLRRAGDLKQMQWPVPKGPSGNNTDALGYLPLVPAYDSYEFQLAVKPGSVIWGYSFFGLYGYQSTGGDAYGLGTMSLQIRDACDDIPLFSETETFLTLFGPSFITIPHTPQRLLPKLMVVGPPGILNVVITNTFGTDLPAQVVLYGGEPR